MAGLTVFQDPKLFEGLGFINRFKRKSLEMNKIKLMIDFCLKTGI